MVMELFATAFQKFVSTMEMTPSYFYSLLPKAMVAFSLADLFGMHHEEYLSVLVELGFVLKKDNKQPQVCCSKIEQFFMVNFPKKETELIKYKNAGHLSKDYTKFTIKI